MADKIEQITTLADGADAHWQVVRGGTVAAQCSLWWTDAPKLPGHTVGVIGHYAAEDAAASGRLLDHACDELGARGCTTAIGPMDGTTWRRYRLLTDRGGEPPFFLEPDNPDEWPDYFLAAGFQPFARYFSALCDDLARTDPRMARVEARMERAGVRIRRLEPARFEAELAAIHALSLVSFQDNLLYSSISLSAFVEQYRPLAAILRPEMVLLAEKEGALAGFVFALPDLLQARRGQPVDTAIVKTAAVLPGREFAGLGGLLVARAHVAAAALGYRRAIHALMHESNESRSLSAHYGRPFRGYTLYARPL
jgi:L-amino acid N-acyltransferase YncA